VIREHGATNIVFEPAARIAHALVSGASISVENCAAPARAI
jgi:hypothetical protein